MRALLPELVVLGPILALGAALRGGLFLAASPGLLNNADGAVFVAETLGGSTVGNALHPPGYMFALRWAFDLAGSASGAIVLQHLAGLAAAAAIYAAVRLLGGARWAAGGGALVAAASGDVVVLGHTFISEQAFLVVLALALLLAATVEHRRTAWPLPVLALLAAALGTVLVAGVIVRTVGLLLLPIFAVWLLGPRPSLRGVALLLAGVAGAGALMGPYLHHRKVETGRASLSIAEGWSAYGRVAQIADCDLMTLPADLRRFCESGPTGAGHRPDVRAYWFLMDASPALQHFGGPGPGNDELARFAAEVRRQMPLESAAVRLRDVVRSAWPAYAQRRSAQIVGPQEELAADVRWRAAEGGTIGPLRDRGLASSYRSDEGRLELAARIQELTRFWPWLLLPTLVAVALGLARGRGRRRPVALLGSVAGTLIAGGAAIQLYNPRYAVPAQPFAAAAALLALQAMGAPAWARTRWRGRGAWRARARARASRTLVAARAAAGRAPRALWVVLGAAALLRIATMLAIQPAITDRESTEAAIVQARYGLWSDLVQAPADPLWARLYEALSIGQGVAAGLQHLLGLVCVLLAYVVVRRLGAPRWAGVGAAALIGLDPDRVALEHLAGASSLGFLGLALAVLLLAVPRPSAWRAVAGGAAATLVLLDLPGTVAWIVALLATAAVAAAGLRAGAGARRAALHAGAVAVVPLVVLTLVTVDTWDVVGGRLRLDAAAPFSRYVAAAQRSTCPPDVAADLRPLCVTGGDDTSRAALAGRVRATAPGDAATQRVLLERWLDAVGGAPPAIVSGLRSAWRRTWVEGRALAPLDLGARQQAIAPRLRAIAEIEEGRLREQVRSGPGDPVRLSRPVPLPELRKAVRRRERAGWIAPDVVQRPPLRVLAAYQDVVRAPAVRWALLLLLLPLALVAAVRRGAAAVLVAAAAITAAQPASETLLLDVAGALVLVGAVGAGLVVQAARARAGGRPRSWSRLRLPRRPDAGPVAHT
jgi:hypothetical protein